MFLRANHKPKQSLNKTYLTFFLPSKINAAGLRYRELLKQWTTHVTLAPTITDSSNAHFETRGFFGDYDVVLELSNGLRSTQKFTLNPGNGPLFMYLHLPGNSVLLVKMPFFSLKQEISC